jgi:uracil-DNA glycosylase family 4
MAKQKAFFLSPLEIYKKEHPEAFEKKRRSSGSSSKPKKEKVFNCETCGLSSKCKKPKIQRYGKGEKGILIVGLCPGRNEDKYGIPLIGASGSFLQKKLDLLGINLDRDCIRTNIVRCFPGLDKSGSDIKPTNDQILCCASKLRQDIEEVKPQLIIALGTQAIKSLVDTKGLSSFSVSGTHGLCFPNQEFQAWVGCSYHPSYFCRKKHDRGPIKDDIIFINDLADILAVLGEPLPKPLTKEGNILITDYKEAIDYIEYIIDEGKPTCHDFETNEISCYTKEDARILTVSLSNDVGSAACIPFDFQWDGESAFTESQLIKVILAFNEYLASDVPKVLQNYYMEELWGRYILGQSMNNFVHDTMVSAHVLNCRRLTTNLGFQAYQLTGHDYKKMVNTSKLQEESIEQVACYNNWDTRYTLLSYQDQKRRLAADPELKKFDDWLTNCLRCLANLKHRGMIIDTQILDDLDEQYSKEIKDLYDTIKNLGKVKEFESIEDKKGKKKVFNPDSHVHLGKLIYEMWKEPKKRKTKGGEKGAADKEALVEISENTQNPEVKLFTSSLLRYRKCGSLTKRVENYRRLLDPNNVVHPSFCMHTAATYRSSCSEPNAQNVFNHDEELQVFRKCVKPRPGNIFLEVDYSGMEVRGIGMLSKDEELERQLILMEEWDKEHPEGGPNPWDTHRRWSAKVYEKVIEEVTKLERYAGKNGFVFPSFYGSIPSSIARYEDFRGIPEKHIRDIQEEFWAEYKGVRRWQKESIDYYNKYGGYLGPMGCKRPGPLSLFQLYNNNIQGLAFHLLLDALQRIDDEMIRRGMVSYAFIEIHDSITFDTVPEEVEILVPLATEIMTSKRFDWQRDVPLAVEWEAGTDWYNKSASFFKELVGVR